LSGACYLRRRGWTAFAGRATLRAVRYHEQQPRFIPPMLLASCALPSGDAWTFEVKWDGCRAQLRYHGRSVSLRTRSGRECAADFPELAEIAGVLRKRRVTLDGELVCLRPDGRPDFGQLRPRLTGSTKRRHPAMLQAFDLLHLDGNSTRVLPYGERRSLLEELALDGPAWRTPASVVVERHEDFVARVEDLGLEGVVAKRLSSSYLPGRRCTAWVKRKLRREERLAVTGVRRNRDGNVDAIFVARHQSDGSFTRAGAIELGLYHELVERLEARLTELPARRRGSIAWYPAQLSVVASLHGLADGPVRDAVLREVLDGAVAST
jgi:bifunctional non-homologous end joining protein LigD